MDQCKSGFSTLGLDWHLKPTLVRISKVSPSFFQDLFIRFSSVFPDFFLEKARKKDFGFPRVFQDLFISIVDSIDTQNDETLVRLPLEVKVKLHVHVKLN